MGTEVIFLTDGEQLDEQMIEVLRKKQAEATVKASEGVSEEIMQQVMGQFARPGTPLGDMLNHLASHPLIGSGPLTAPRGLGRSALRQQSKSRIDQWFATLPEHVRNKILMSHRAKKIRQSCEQRVMTFIRVKRYMPGIHDEVLAQRQMRHEAGDEAAKLTPEERKQLGRPMEDTIVLAVSVLKGTPILSFGVTAVGLQDAKTASRAKGRDEAFKRLCRMRRRKAYPGYAAVEIRPVGNKKMLTIGDVVIDAYDHRVYGQPPNPVTGMRPLPITEEVYEGRWFGYRELESLINRRAQELLDTMNERLAKIKAAKAETEAEGQG